jgi:DNA-binding transcriptional regulator YiaG
MEHQDMYHYTECGLQDVYLVNGFTIDEEGIVFIENIHGLHKAIGQKLIFTPDRLKGDEIRFIRHYMDWSQQSMGKLLGVSHQTVLRWEQGHVPINETADHYVRGLFYEILSDNARFVDIVNDIADLDSKMGETSDWLFTHQQENSQWKVAA